MRTGRITLYDNNRPANSQYYNSAFQRDAIIKSWQVLYKARFREMWYHIAPTTRASEFDVKLVADWKRMRQDGLTWEQIGDRTGVAGHTVSNYLSLPGVMAA